VPPPDLLTGLTYPRHRHPNAVVRVYRLPGLLGLVIEIPHRWMTWWRRSAPAIPGAGIGCAVIADDQPVLCSSMSKGASLLVLGSHELGRFTAQARRVSAFSKIERRKRAAPAERPESDFTRSGMARPPRVLQAERGRAPLARLYNCQWQGYWSLRT
jgi:hypothetical protein